jgi:hypothetical protein
LLEGSPISGATNALLTLCPVQSRDSGHYSVQVANPAGSVSTAPALLNVAAATTFQLSASASLAPAATGFTFQLSVPPGSTYIVQATSDLSNWMPIATNTASADSTGIVSFTDNNAVNYPNRFYRAVIP